jgi:hypothetical protein
MYQLIPFVNIPLAAEKGLGSASADTFALHRRLLLLITEDKVFLEQHFQD